MDIGLDMDGVLVHDRWLHFLDFLSAQGIRCNAEAWLATNCWEEATGLSPEQTSQLYVHFQSSPFFTPTQALEGAGQSLEVLQRKHMLHLITSRPEQEKKRTLHELRTFFPTTPFASHRFGGWNRKALLMQECQGNLLIEDNVKLACQVAEVAAVILFPTHGNIRFDRHPKLIYPSTAKTMHEQMSPAEWATHNKQTWAEIVQLTEEVANNRIACISYT